MLRFDGEIGSQNWIILDYTFISHNVYVEFRILMLWGCFIPFWYSKIHLLEVSLELHPLKEEKLSQKLKEVKGTETLG